jgi:hypothetical protein
MATFSYPAVGLGGLNETQWSTMYNSPDGVINDYSGGGLALTVVNGSTIARIAAGFGRVNGYTIENTADLDLTIPSAVGTYYVAAQYNPALNVADASGNANPVGPVSLVISDVLDTAGNKAHTVLHRLIRTVAAGAVTTTDLRQHIGDTFSVSVMPNVKRTDPETTLTGWVHPLGSIAYERSSGDVFVKLPSTTGSGTYWQSQSFETPIAFPANSPLTANAANEAPFYYFTSNRAMVHLEGTLKRVSGAAMTSTGVDVTLGTLPAGARPKKQYRGAIVGKLASGWTTCQLTVLTDGTVVLYDNNIAVTWVDLSGVSFRVRS